MQELAGLDAWLGRHACRVDRVSCRVPEGARAWDVAGALRELGRLANAGAIDLLLDLPFQDESAHAGAVAEALFAGGAPGGPGRLWLAPLVDLDRSMDVALGLLDRLSNPRPAFDAARTLNTVLYARQPAGPETFTPAQVWEGAGGHLLGLRGDGRRLWLSLPAGGSGPAPDTAGMRIVADEALVCYDLVAGTSERLAPDAEGARRALARASGPALLEARQATDTDTHRSPGTPADTRGDPLRPARSP